MPISLPITTLLLVDQVSLIQTSSKTTEEVPHTTIRSSPHPITDSPMRSPPQHASSIVIDKYEASPRHIPYGPFYPQQHRANHPPRLATNDSSSSSSFSPRSPPSPQLEDMTTSSSPSKMSLSSAPFRPAPMRLPSFAELNERLSLSSGKASFYDNRDRPVLPSPSEIERPAIQSARYAGKMFTPLSEPSPEARDGHPHTVKTATPSATEEGRGLTSSWLPIDDPGRSTGISQHSRRATNPAYDQPSPQYSWSPRQQSPPWNSSPSSAGPTPASSSSGAHARYHPFRRAPSYSPEHSHPPQMNGSQQGHQQSYPQSPSLHSPPMVHHQHHAHTSMKNGPDGHDGGASGQGSSAIPRRRGKLPKDVTERLKTWLMEHASHPYPNEDEKRRLCMQTGLSISQVSNWFINARRRILAPQMSTSAPASAGGMSALAERERHLQYGQPHQHHHQHYSSQNKHPYHHHQQQQQSHHPHVHSYAGQYASPDPRRTVPNGVVGRRGSDGLSADRSPILTHSEDEYHGR